MNTINTSSASDIFSDGLKIQDSVSEKNTSSSIQPIQNGFATQLAGLMVADASLDSPVSQVASGNVPISLDGKNYLLKKSSDMLEARNNKPNIKQFMDAARVDFKTASSILNGVIGHNTDYRDWKSIMTSLDPLAAARAATGAMYNSDLPYNPKPDSNDSSKINVQARSGNFAWIEVNQKSNLWLVNKDGAPLREVGLNAPVILKAARDFGFDLSSLADLSSQLDEIGVKYLPGQLYANSDHGVNLRDLAAGKLGTAYDWTVDPLVYMKGQSALAYLESRQKMAQELNVDKTLSSLNKK